VSTSPPPGDLTNGQASQPTEGSEPPAPQTPEEVEAIWRNRFSQRDRAHNAEVQSLRDQLTALQQTPPPPAPSADGTVSPDSGYKARWEQTQRELQQEREARAIDQRRGKYAALAGEVPAADPMWASALDESLARLNAQLSGPPAPPAPTGPIDRNNPRRDLGTPMKNPDDMTKDELLQELARLSPAEEARMRELG
jgi:hypothetical protein